MDNQIVQIDLSRVDADIADKLKIIESAQKELEVLYKLKEYSKTYAARNVQPVTNGYHVKRIETSGDFPTPTNFVLHLLDLQEKADTKSIIQAWADYKGEEYNDVRNAVFNVLTTLKKAGKIRGERNEELNITVYSKNRAGALL